MRQPWPFLIKYWRPLCVTMAVFMLIRLAVPCPLRGNWVGNYTAHLCDDHAFLRFADGRAAYYHGDLDPQYNGFYEKIGWNTYSVRYSRADNYPRIISVGWFFMRMGTKGVVEGRWWLHRDLNIIAGRRIVIGAQLNARR